MLFARQRIVQIELCFHARTIIHLQVEPQGQLNNPKTLEIGGIKLIYIINEAEFSGQKVDSAVLWLKFALFDAAILAI